MILVMYCSRNKREFTLKWTTSLIMEYAKNRIFIGNLDLSDYQQEVNAAAEKICLRNPHMICKRGTLLELARKEVHDSGYVYKKGKSRSKAFGTCENTPKR